MTAENLKKHYEEYKKSENKDALKDLLKKYPFLERNEPKAKK